MIKKISAKIQDDYFLSLANDDARIRTESSGELSVNIAPGKGQGC